MSFGFILRHKETRCCKYFHSSCNCCGRYIETPALISDSQSFERFLDRIRQLDLLQYVMAQRPDPGWTAGLVTNATFYLNVITQNPKGYLDVRLADYLRVSKVLTILEIDQHDEPYTGNLCLFRCLAIHRGAVVTDLKVATLRLYADYTTEVSASAFAGVPLNELDRVEAVFQTSVIV
ncbi:MAG: hypothetical protein M3H12_14965 [Chromatiales bacterium]